MQFFMTLLDGAADSATASAGGMSSLLSIGMLVAMVAIFYFLILRPQKKREKEQNQMRSSIEIGDEITTIGGIIGAVVSIKDETVTIETSKDKTKIRILKSAISSVDVKASDYIND